MAWDTTFPIVHGTTEWAVWRWVIQFWKACRERAWATGAEFFPRTTLTEDPAAYPTSYCPTAPGYTGIIDGAPSASGANYIITDTDNQEFNPDITVWAAEAKDKDWEVSPQTRWYDYVHPVDERYPRFFDIVIEYSEIEPYQVVRAKILGNTANTLTVEGGPLDDAVEAGQIPSVAALNGKRYVIVRQDSTSHRSVHWHDRWLPWPNCEEIARGSIESPTTTTVTDHHARWDVNQHAGREMMAVSGGRLKRFAITSNTPDTLTFTSRGVVPAAGTPYVVIDAGGVWRSNKARGPSALWRWYSGADRSMVGIQVQPEFYSHWPDQTIQSTPVPAMTIKLRVTDETGSVCEDADVDAFDNDVWSAPDPDTDPQSCDELDRPYSPWLYQTFRALQGWVEGICAEFVEAKSYDNVGAIPAFTPATWGLAAGHTAFTRTVTAASASGVYVDFGAITLPTGLPLPAVVHYTILDADGEPMVYGFTYAASTVNGDFGHLTGTLTSTTRISLRGATAGESEAGSYPPDQATMDAWVGKTIVVYLGMTRYFPRRVRTLRAKTVFVAANGAEPPTNADPGVYATRAASARYLEYTEQGEPDDSTTALFVNGELARYVGDQWHDFYAHLGDSVDDGTDDETEYRDRQFVGVRPREFGTATSGTATQLTDSTRSRDNRWWEAGVLRTDSGTGSIGSTSLSDGSKSGSAFWNGTTGRWVGFVVEVEVIDNAVTTWVRRPITSHTVGSQTISWAEPLPVADIWASYRIREPKYELNRWKGCTVRIFLPGGPVEREVTHSDDDTLFFATVATELAAVGLTAIPAGTSYHVIEWQPGAVLKWNSGAGKWEKPTGTDARTALPFLDDVTANMPTMQRRFGRIRKGDYMHRQMFHELRDGINELVWTKQDGFWEKDAVEYTTSSDDQNYVEGNTIPSDETPTYAELKAAIESDWSTSPAYDPGPMSTGVPNAGAKFFNEESGQAWAQYMYAVVENTKTTRMNHTAQAHVYSSTDPDDFGEYLAGSEPVGAPTGVSVYFRAHGSGARYRKWAPLGTGSPGTLREERVKVGDLDVPNDWPPEGANSIGKWSAVGNPVVIYKWDVTGGMQYVG